MKQIKWLLARQSQHLMQTVAITCFLLHQLPSTIYAQHNSAWYQYNNNDLKNYSVEVIPSSAQNRESVMAGTVFDANGFGKIHFLRFDDGPTAGVDEYPGMITTKIYNDAAYYDERAVDIEINTRTPNRYFITALSRIQPPAGVNGTLYNDRIKVLEVDGNGAVTNEIVIYENTINPNSQFWGYGLYPIHSYFRENVWDGSSMHDLLYICGYMTMENTMTTKYPTFTTSKQIFLLTLDVTSSVWSLANWMSYDGSVTPTTNTPELDYDIAMRIQEITTGPYIGDMFLTGSLTEKTGIYNGPPYPYTCVRSATLSMQLDPWDLGNLSGFIDNSFIDLGNVDGAGFNEFGIGMVESDNSNDKYIISNRYDNTSTCNGRPADDWDNIFGFNDKVHGFWVTHTDPSFSPSTTRLFYDQGWISNVLPEPNGSSGITSRARFLLAGMTRWNVPFCSQSQTISNSNITPFIFDLDVHFPVGGITEVASQLNMYPNQTGTGNPGAFGNTFTNLGGGLSYIAWHPTFAARELNTTDVVLLAPKWDNGNNRLGIKPFFVHPNTLDMTGGACTDVCSLSDQNMQIEPAVGEDKTQSMTTMGSTSTPSDLFPDALPGDCLGYVSAGSVYKNGQTTLKPFSIDSRMADIFPNPAKTEIFVKLGNDLDKKVPVRILLINIYGQVITTLYDGTVTDLKPSRAITLPDVAKGLYMVDMYQNNQKVFTQRLVIQ